MIKIRKKIIHLLGGFTKVDLENGIEKDRNSRDIPRTIQFEISLEGKFENEDDNRNKRVLYNTAFTHLMNNAKIHKIYNPMGNYTNYFLTYDIPIKSIMEEIEYNVKEDK